MSPTAIPYSAGTGADFVNHELSATLDSTNAFEGPEKLLEIWFSPSKDHIVGSATAGSANAGLRSIPLPEIEAMLDLVNCKILSKISSVEMDSYLLSESSLFVFPHKMILKTCGTTTTLLCLDKLFELLAAYLPLKNVGPSSVYRIFYSRRSFMFPERQVELHQSWDNEMVFLNRYFNKRTSKAYVVGDLSNDHWYLYINGTHCELENELSASFLSPPSSPPPVLASDNACPGPVDETFELLMTDLCVKETPKFVSSTYHDLQEQFPEMDLAKDDYGHLLGLKTMAKTKLNQLFKKKTNSVAKHDLFLFDPCGFSSNSIVDDEYYYTLHVTPEEGWSYASFETNLPYDPELSKSDIMLRVLDVFKPGKFCLVYMKEQDSYSDLEFESLYKCQIEGYSKIDKICYDLQFNYKCLYSYFEKIEQ